MQKSRKLLVGRYFRGLPVEDATFSFPLMPKKEDIKKGQRLNPNGCVFAQYCKRTLDSAVVLFLRTSAYIEMTNPKGKRVVYRFNIPPATRKAIIAFDKTGEMPEGGFLLKAPTPSTTLTAHTAYARKYAREVASGKRSPERRGSNPNTQKKTMYGVRDGRGKLGINYAY